jgi:hypothetical protein
MSKINTALSMGLVAVSLFGCNLLERYKVEDNSAVEQQENIYIETEVVELPNTIYFGEYQDNWFLYLRNSSNRDFVVSQIVPATNDVYELNYDEPIQIENFEQLSNPKIVYEGDESEEIYLGSAVFDGRYLYLSFHFDSTNSFSYPDKSGIIQFDTVTGKSDNLMEKYLFGSEEEGAAYNVVSIFDGKYLVYYISGCYGCGDWLSRMVYVMNLETNETKFLGNEVGGFEVDGNTISFRQLIQTEEVEDCFADICGVYKPEGEENRVELPF